MLPNPLPQDLQRALSSESADFVVKAKRAYPLKKSLSLLFFSMVWLAITGIVSTAFLGPILQGKEVNFTSNGVPMTASPDNLGPLLLPGIFMSLFLLIGIGMLTHGIYTLLAKGGYFVGTSARLVTYRKGNIRSIDWEQFTGNIEMHGNDRNGSISLEMRTGKMQSQRNGPDRYVPDIINLSGIPRVMEIEQICRKRIKENDPTPTVSQVNS